MHLREFCFTLRERTGGAMSKHKILIPLDGSKFCQQILPYVCDFFSPTDNELILLRVAPEAQGLLGMPPRPVAVHWAAPMYPSQRDVELAQHPIYTSQVWDSQVAVLKNELREALLYLGQAGFTVSSVIRSGQPAHEILNLIAEEKVDLVVMTSHGRTGLSRLMFGSVAEEILREAAVPVMVLRPKALQRALQSPDQGQD
jgi:nucleotide-binding universal stress UspA family protein